MLAAVLTAAGLFSTTAIVYASIVMRSWPVISIIALTLPFTLGWLLVAVNGRLGFRPGRRTNRPPVRERLDS